MQTGYTLVWKPVTNVYSPPVLHPDVKKADFYLQPEQSKIIGLLIGRNGYHFKRITEISGCLYIFYIGCQTIEVWGTPQSIHRAFCMLQKHVSHHMLR